jgi:hypothetical protein
LTTAVPHRDTARPAQVDEELVLEGALDAVGVAEVVDRRAPGGEAGQQRLAHRLRQRVPLRAREGARRAQRMDARPEQRLVGVDVAHPRDAPLVEQEGLDGSAPAACHPSQRLAGELAVEGLQAEARAKKASRAAVPSASSPVPKRRGSQKRSSWPSSRTQRTRSYGVSGGGS